MTAWIILAEDDHHDVAAWARCKPTRPCGCCASWPRAAAGRFAPRFRVLNHATFPRGELSESAIASNALGQLATAAHRLPQLCGQLARWLAEESTAGRLARTIGGLACVLAGLDLSARLGGALNQAHQATAWLHQPGGGGEDR